MRLLFYWRTKQKIRETRLERCAARESQYAALHLLTLFAPKAALAGTSGAMPRRLLVGTPREKAALAGTSGGNVTQIAFGKYERKSGVCRNVWEDAKV